MSVPYVQSSNAELRITAREKLPVLTMDDALLQIVAPIDHSENDMVMWETEDDITGLMESRTLNGEFGVINRTGAKSFTMNPSYWGNKIILDEARMTQARELGTFGSRLDVSKAQAKDQDHLLNLAIDRILYIISQFALSGKYYTNGLNGALILAQEVTIQTFTSTNPVNVVNTATPLVDLRAIRLKGRGTSADFGKSAVILMNAVTVNAFLANTNAGDLGKYLVINGGSTATPLDLTSLNRILQDQNLPTIVEYEGHYVDSAGQVQMRIPDGKAILVAKRPDGEPPMRWVFTANMNNMRPNSPDFQGEMKLSDIYYSWKWEEDPIRGISTMGFNGGLTVPHPKAMLAWTLW